MATSIFNRGSRAQAFVGRRQFVVLGGLAAGMLALGELAPAARAGSATNASDSSQTYTPGTYTATSRGKKAPLTVSVTFEEHSIASVEVTESGDTPRISSPAISTIPGQIVACQSLGIDSVSGATYTSLAIVNAVADCVDQAGGDSAALREAPGAQKSTETVEMDVDLAVVGAGAAGMAAALEGALQGGTVAVLEKCAYIGGNALVSGGVLTYIDAPQELRQEVNDGYRNYFQQALEQAAQIGVPQEHIDYVQQQWDEYYADGTTTLFDSPEWQAICDLLASGAESVSEEDYQGTLAYAQSNLPLMQWLSQFEIPYSRLCSVVGYPWPDNVRTQEGECGEGWFAGFDDYISRTNPTIDFLFSTPATELIQGDGGAVAGIVGTSLMPALSAFLLYLATKTSAVAGGQPQFTEAQIVAGRSSKPGPFVRLCLALCMTYVVIGLLDVANGYSPLAVGPASIDLSNFLGSGFGVAMAVALVVFNVRVDAGRLYRWLVPVLMLGLAFCAQGGPGGSALSTVICTGADVCVQAMAILCVFAMHRDDGLGVALGIGFAQGSIQLGVLVGNALGTSAFGLAVDGAGLDAQVALVLGCLLCCFAALVPQAQHRGGEEKSDLCTVIQAVARRYRLTQRESEVLDLLAQGRTQPYIRDALQLSKGTVATHAAHIYAKLDVHSKQELIDLVEAAKGKAGLER